MAAEPLSSWNFSSVRNAAKSTEPSLLNGVISATNEPASIFDIFVSMREFRTIIPRHRRPASGNRRRISDRLNRDIDRDDAFAGGPDDDRIEVKRAEFSGIRRRQTG